MDWSQLGCGRGHVTFAPDEPGLRERLSVATREGPAWRCLRCGTFVVGEPAATGPAAKVPLVRRGTELRSALILRIFAVERFIRALIVAVLAIAVWRFSASRLSLEESYHRALPALRALLTDLGYSVQHSKVLGLINKAFTTDPKLLAYIAIGLAAYAVVEVIEGIGLWLVKRWGEYFAMIATSAGLPIEIDGLIGKPTVLKLVAFLINLGLVVYLVLTKRLFGARGGRKAYEARLRSESIMDAELAALAAGQHPEPAPAAEPVHAGQPGAGAVPSPGGGPPAAAGAATAPIGPPPAQPAPAAAGSPVPGEAPGTDEAGADTLPRGNPAP